MNDTASIKAPVRNNVQKQDRRSFLQRLAHASEPYLYSAPALILIGAVMLVPLILGVSYAFRDIQLLNPFSGGYVGLDHFRELATDQAFYRSLKIHSGGPVARCCCNSCSGLFSPCCSTSHSPDVGWHRR